MDTWPWFHTLAGTQTRGRHYLGMGCGGSKAGEAVEDPKGVAKDAEAATKTEDVNLDTTMNAAGRRVSKTVRRIAVRCVA